MKAMALLRLVRTKNLITVILAGPGFGQINMPYLLGLLAHRDPRLALRMGTVEQAELDFTGVFRKQGKIHTCAIPCRPQWIRFSWPDFHSFFRAQGVSS